MKNELPSPDYKSPENPPKRCEHKWVHLDTKKSSQYDSWQTKWTVIDRFYCEKCMEIVLKKQEEYLRDKPDWY